MAWLNLPSARIPLYPLPPAGDVHHQTGKLEQAQLGRNWHMTSPATCHVQKSSHCALCPEHSPPQRHQPLAPDRSSLAPPRSGYPRVLSILTSPNYYKSAHTLLEARPPPRCAQLRMRQAAPIESGRAASPPQNQTHRARWVPVALPGFVDGPEPATIYSTLGTLQWMAYGSSDTHQHKQHTLWPTQRQQTPAGGRPG